MSQQQRFLSVPFLAALLLCGCTAEKPYPHRPITLICPWGAGGGTDSVSRQIAAHLERELGVPISVVNATGGKGVTGHNRGFSARPDGYTLTMATLELNMLHWSGLTRLTYDDCTPLMSVNEDYAALFVRNDAPWQTLSELENEIRAHPKELTATGTASGGAWHLALAGWLLEAGMKADDVVWISSTGAAPSLKELMSGGVDMVCCSLPEAATQMKNGDVRPLGIMAPARASGFPAVPTFAEQGRDWSLGGWRGLAVPKGTPPKVVHRLVDALEKVVTGQTKIQLTRSGANGGIVRKETTFPEFMAVQGFDATHRGPEEFRQFLAETDDKLGKLLTSDAMRSVNRDRYNAMAFPYVLIGLIMAVLAILAGQHVLRDPRFSLLESGLGDRMPIQNSGSKAPHRDVSSSSAIALPNARGLTSFAFVVGGIALYATAVETVGYVILTSAIIWLLLWKLGTRLWVCTAVTLLVVPLTYQLFNGVLRVPLPPGWWGW